MIDIRQQIYNTKEEIARHKKSIEKSSMTERNKQLILEFTDFCAALGNSPNRISIVLWHLKIFGELMEIDFDTANRKDLEKARS